jgi:drug/metabolite transporter (DMT)-like permease
MTLGRWSERSMALSLLVAANVLFAGQGVAVKCLDMSLNPLAIALLPFYTAILVGGVFLLCTRRRRWRLAWQARTEFLLLGTAGQFLAQVGMTVGVSWSLASNGAILSMLIPLVSALLATRLLQERLTPLRIGSLLLSIVGVILLTPLRPLTAGSWMSYPFAGTLMIGVGCFGSAFYNVYSRRLLDRFTDLEVLFFSYLATSVVGLPVLLASDRRLVDQLVHLDLRGWVALGYLTIFLYGLAMVFYLRALRHVDAILAAASLYLIPIFGVALAVVFLGERLQTSGVAGSAVVLAATFLLFRFDHAARSL